MTTRPRVRFSAEDIFDVPDDQYRYEVIEGDLYLSPSPSWIHQRSLFNLARRLDNWVDPRRLGKIVLAPLGVVLDDANGVQPDLMYISNERAGIISQRGLEGPPDLVVAVLSPSTESRDRGIKFKRYGASGIPHYSMLAPETKSLEAYRLGEDGYALVGVFGQGTVFQPELFPGLEIPIDELWD